MTVGIPTMSGATYKVHEELIRVRESLRGRVKMPELEIAVSVELASRLKAEYVRAATNSHIRPLIVGGVPPLAGHRIFTDGDLSGLQFRIVQVFPIKEVTNAN